MYCTSCGKEVRDSAKFCEACGKPLSNGEDISFYNNSNYNNNMNNQYVNQDSSEGKAVGVICALFVPLLISIFIGLVFKDPVARSNYYKYFGITYLIKFGVSLVIFVVLIIIMSSLPDYNMINTFLNLIKL